MNAAAGSYTGGRVPRLWGCRSLMAKCLHPSFSWQIVCGWAGAEHFLYLFEPLPPPGSVMPWGPQGVLGAPWSNQGGSILAHQSLSPVEGAEVRAKPQHLALSGAHQWHSAFDPVFQQRATTAFGADCGDEAVLVKKNRWPCCFGICASPPPIGSGLLAEKRKGNAGWFQSWTEVKHFVKRKWKHPEVCKRRWNVLFYFFRRIHDEDHAISWTGNGFISAK